MLTNHNNTTNDHGPRIIEINDQFLQEQGRPRSRRLNSDRPLSQREMLTNQFSRLQQRISHYQYSQDIPQEIQQLVQTLSQEKVPRHLEELTTWVQQTEQLLSWIKERVAKADAVREVERQRRHLERLYLFFREDYEQADGHVEALAALYSGAVELYDQDLEDEKVYQAKYGPWLDWSERFMKNAGSKRSDLCLQKSDGRYGHRWGFDPDQRRAWRQQRAKVRGRKW
jgi:hypothetical protein